LQYLALDRASRIGNE